MSKYGKAKYGKNKYGRYEIEISTDQPLSQIVKYRLRTIDSLKRYSRPLVNMLGVAFVTGGPVKVRLRADSADWIYQQGETLSGEKIRIRVKGISGDRTESRWVESVAGTIKNA